MCNSSLEQGVFPDDMKIARVIPLFKSGDNQTVSNYRPISLLPQFSKILENIQQQDNEFSKCKTSIVFLSVWF